MRVNPDEWDAFARERQDHLLDRKRMAAAATDANAQPVGRLVRGEYREQRGWAPDWKLQQLMLKEARQEEFSDMRRREMAVRVQRLDWAGKMSAQMKQAWAAGKFATRKQAYLKRTDARVARAQRLRGQGWTYQQIGDAIGITVYTAMKWLGWTRKPEPTNRHPVTFEGVTYPSIREAARVTGRTREIIRKRATP